MTLQAKTNYISKCQSHHKMDIKKPLANNLLQFYMDCKYELISF